MDMKKTIYRAALSMLIALCFMSAVPLSAAAENTAAATKAKIAFTEGDMEIKDGDLGTGLIDMSIDFGDNPLPAGATTYTAVDGAHTLRVQDGRTTAGEWEVTVEMHKFVNQDDAANTFDAIITLSDGETLVTSQTQSGTFTVPETVTIDSESQGAVMVMSTTSGFSHGTFDATWAQENITLSIDNDAAKVTQPDHEYHTTLVWTLGSV